MLAGVLLVLGSAVADAQQQRLGQSFPLNAVGESLEVQGVVLPERGDASAVVRRRLPTLQLPTGIYSFSGTAFDAPDYDLVDLGKVIGDVTVVGLGESWHGSEGFAQARARLIRYLVEHKGFRAVAFEGPWGPALATARYLEDGEGVLLDAVLGLSFKVWKSKSTAALLEWLKEFNQLHPDDPVRFFGYDIQQGLWDGNYVRGALSTIAPNETTLRDGTRSCAGAKYDTIEEVQADPEELEIYNRHEPFPEDRYLACTASLGQIAQYLSEHEQDALKVLTAAELDLLSLSVTTLRAYTEAVYLEGSTTGPEPVIVRDRVMAEVFLRFRQRVGVQTKIVLWAHNFHIARNLEQIDDPNYYKTMGSWLGEALGSSYAPIGLIASSIDTCFPTRCTTIPFDAAGSVEAQLRTLAEPFLLVDLLGQEVSGPFVSPTTPYTSGYDVPFTLPERYRGLVYLATSTPALDRYD